MSCEVCDGSAAFSDVIVREGGRFSTPRPLGQARMSLEYWIPRLRGERLRVTPMTRRNCSRNQALVVPPLVSSIYADAEFYGIYTRYRHFRKLELNHPALWSLTHVTSAM